MTNAEFLNARGKLLAEATVDKFVKLIAGDGCYYFCPVRDECDGGKTCKKSLLKWLKAPAAKKDKEKSEKLKAIESLIEFNESIVWDRRYSHADRIRKMSNKELADFIFEIPCHTCSYEKMCIKEENSAATPNCKAHVLEWLEQLEDGIVLEVPED